MAGVIEGFRWALTGQEWPRTADWASAGAVVLVLLSGLLYFRRMEGDDRGCGVSRHVE